MDIETHADSEDFTEVDITLEDQRDRFVAWFLDRHAGTNEAAVDRVLDEAVASLRPSKRVSEIARAVERLIQSPR